MHILQLTLKTHWLFRSAANMSKSSILGSSLICYCHVLHCISVSSSLITLLTYVTLHPNMALVWFVTAV